MWRWGAQPGLAAALSLLVACGGRSETGTGSGNGDGAGAQSSGPISEDDFIAQVSPVVCDSLERCCSEQGYAFNPAICILFGTPERGAHYDAQAAGACLDELRTADCDQGTSSACDRVYSGDVQVGGACTSDVECAPVAGAEIECDSFDEVCTSVVRGSEGDPCSQTCESFGVGAYSCFSFGSSEQLTLGEEVRCYKNDGLVCGSDFTCKAIGELGDPCQSDNDCPDAAHCAFDTDVCTARAAVGEACDVFDAPCVDGAFCNDTGECQALKAAGEACAGLEECQGSCTGGMCEENSDLAEGLIGLVCGGAL